MAVGSSVGEDTDDMFDDLFRKYGKVVFRSNDQKAASAEVDDDAESLSFAVALAKVASDVKAAELRVLFLKPLVYWTRFFIIATAFSRPRIDAIGSKMRYLAETQYGRTASGDSKPNSWTLLDFGDVVVCIYFFLSKEISTTWKSSTAMLLRWCYHLKTNDLVVENYSRRQHSSDLIMMHDMHDKAVRNSSPRERIF